MTSFLIFSYIKCSGDFVGLYQKIKSYVLEEKFKMQVGYHYIDIINYTKIKKIEHTEIQIIIENTIITIKGTNLAIQKLLNDEVFITGKIEQINMGSDTKDAT
jgi:sporulation protein YqfC